jgi:hypothetical protein
VPDTTAGRDAVASIDRGDMDGCSFGFRVASDGDDWETVEGENVRTINKFASLFDVGPVTYPAYSATSVDVRSLIEAGIAGAAEARAVTTIEYDDPSIVYACRCLIDYSRATFDRLQRVIDCVAAVQGELTPADMEAANDAVSSLVDLLAKAKKCKVSSRTSARRTRRTRIRLRPPLTLRPGPGRVPRQRRLGWREPHGSPPARAADGGGGAGRRPAVDEVARFAG